MAAKKQVRGDKSVRKSSVEINTDTRKIYQPAHQEEKRSPNTIMATLTRSTTLEPTITPSSVTLQNLISEVKRTQTQSRSPRIDRPNNGTEPRIVSLVRQLEAGLVGQRAGMLLASIGISIQQNSRGQHIISSVAEGGSAFLSKRGKNLCRFP